MTTNPLGEARFLTADADRAAAIALSAVLELDQPRTSVTAATLRATAHGIYEARIDDRPVTDAVLAPGWTSYEWRLAYQDYDVRDLIVAGSGPVRVEVTLGNGWYRGDLGFAGANANYGEEIAVAAVLDISFADGSTQRLATGPGWSAETSDTPRNSLYNGQ